MIAYLDNSATTKPSPGVVGAMARCMEEGYFNPSSLYAPALRAEKAMRQCREQIASALRVAAGDIYFTSGGTEANNLAILGSVQAMRGERHLIATAVEHPSALACFEALRAQGHRVTILRVDSAGQPDWAQLDEALSDPPALVSCMQVNNETGAMPDLGRLIRAVRARAPEALIHVDGVQGFLRVPFDAREVDLYVLSGHKIHGPKGIGALYVRPGTRLRPRQIGGGQEKDLRSGTENTPGVAGLLQAILEMRAMDDLFDSLMAKKLLLYDLLMAAAPEAQFNSPQGESPAAQLNSPPGRGGAAAPGWFPAASGAQPNSPPAEGCPEAGWSLPREGVPSAAPHILNMSFPGVRGEVLLHALEERGVYCSTGSACSSKKRKVSPVLLAMGIDPARAECALRFSLSPYTTEEEIRYTAQEIGEVYPVLKKFQRR